MQNRPKTYFQIPNERKAHLYSQIFWYNTDLKSLYVLNNIAHFQILNKKKSLLNSVIFERELRLLSRAPRREYLEGGRRMQLVDSFEDSLYQALELNWP